MYKHKITKDEVNQLELYRYTGPVEVVNTPEELSEAIKELRKSHLIGFDTESRPAFKKGDYYPVSLVQMAVEDCVYLIRVNLTGFTRELQSIFSDPNIIKAGISILDDIRELQRLAHFEPHAVVEINKVAQSLGVENSGVRNLSGIFLNCRISKSQQTSNWEREELSEGQIAYAATDAWVCHQIYDKLDRQGFLQVDEDFYFRLPKTPDMPRSKFRTKTR